MYSLFSLSPYVSVSFLSLSLSPVSCFLSLFSLLSRTSLALVLAISASRGALPALRVRVSTGCGSETVDTCAGISVRKRGLQACTERQTQTERARECARGQRGGRREREMEVACSCEQDSERERKSEQHKLKNKKREGEGRGGKRTRIGATSASDMAAAELRAARRTSHAIIIIIVSRRAALAQADRADQVAKRTAEISSGAEIKCGAEVTCRAEITEDLHARARARYHQGPAYERGQFRASPCVGRGG
eukprot:111877-Rhodomonas_salina.1